MAQFASETELKQDENCLATFGKDVNLRWNDLLNTNNSVWLHKSISAKLDFQFRKLTISHMNIIATFHNELVWWWQECRNLDDNFMKTEISPFQNRKLISLRFHVALHTCLYLWCPDLCGLSEMIFFFFLLIFQFNSRLRFFVLAKTIRRNCFIVSDIKIFPLEMASCWRFGLYLL